MFKTVIIIKFKALMGGAKKVPHCVRKLVIMYFSLVNGMPMLKLSFMLKIY